MYYIPLTNPVEFAAAAPCVLDVEGSGYSGYRPNKI